MLMYAKPPYDKIGSNMNFPEPFQPDNYPTELRDSLWEVLEALNFNSLQNHVTQEWFIKCKSFTKSMVHQIADRIIKLNCEKERQLNILYLVNDMLLKELSTRNIIYLQEQNNILQAFRPHLGVMLRAVNFMANSDVKNKLNKLLEFWGDMGIFSPEIINEIEIVAFCSPWLAKKNGNPILDQQTKIQVLNKARVSKDASSDSLSDSDQNRFIFRGIKCHSQSDFMSLKKQQKLDTIDPRQEAIIKSSKRLTVFEQPDDPLISRTSGFQQNNRITSSKYNESCNLSNFGPEHQFTIPSALIPVIVRSNLQSKSNHVTLSELNVKDVMPYLKTYLPIKKTHKNTIKKILCRHIKLEDRGQQENERYTRI